MIAPNWRALLSLIRPRQWVKNVFVLAPLLFTGQFVYAQSVLSILVATILFCLVSSAIYIINDWRDVERDRLHPTKCHKRPLAAGTVTLTQAGQLLAAITGLLLILMPFCAAMYPKVVVVVAIYFLLNLAYCFCLKNIPVIDIFIIASGFVLRMIAGAMALTVHVSSWMFVTTLCLALYLATVKRRQELLNNGTEARESLRGYTAPLLERYAQMGATGALVFYGLFTLSSHPELIITIPLVIFGMFRYWWIVEQGGGESPTDALLSDWALLATCVAWALLCATRLTGVL